MAELSALDGLLAQFKEQARDTIRADFQDQLNAANEEADRFRSENALLNDSIQEQHLIHQDVVEMRDELARKVQSQADVIEELQERLRFRVPPEQSPSRDAPGQGGSVNYGSDREPLHRNAHSGPAVRGCIFGAFMILEESGTKYYRNMFDGSTISDQGEALRKASISFKPSKVVPRIFKPHWNLVGIAEASEHTSNGTGDVSFDSMCPGRKERDQNSAERRQKDVNQHKISCQLPTHPKAQRDYLERKQAPGILFREEVSWSDRARAQDDSQASPRKRNFDPRQRGSTSTLATKRNWEEIESPEELKLHLAARRPVCIRCWRTGETCDREAKCGACVRAKVTCEHSVCRYGFSCRLLRCPRVHPGQWNDQDTDWVLANVDMSWRTKDVDKQRQEVSSPPAMDSLRPGQ